MTTFEAMMLMLTFGLLIVAMLSQDKEDSASLEKAKTEV